jgi:hypothetical protein
VSTDELRAMLADPDPDVRWKARMLVLLPVSGHLEEAAGALRELNAMLADPDPEVARRAEDVRRARLHGGQSDHALVLLKVLADKTAGHAWPDCLELLAAVALDEMFDWLVTVLAKTTKDGLGDRLAAALGLPGGRDLPRFATEQAGDGACVTCWSCPPDATGPEGGDDASHAVSTARCARVSALVALLDSRHERVRQRAVQELAGLGPGMAGVLRAVRRSRSRPRVRRGALVVLAELGWRELGPADRDLLTRFLRTQPPAHPLLPAVLRELPWPWNDLSWRLGPWKLTALPHTPATEQAALDALTTVLSDLPPAAQGGDWSDESWELYDRFEEEASHRLEQLRRWYDLVTREGISEVLHGWAQAADPPVPGWWIGQQADQIAARWADSVLRNWVYEALRWLEQEPSDVERIAAVTERCIDNNLAGDDAVSLLHRLGAPHGEQALSRVVRNDRVYDHTRARAREWLIHLRRPGYDARGQQPAQGDDEPLLPPAVRDLPYGWGFGFQWPPELPETAENFAYARAILEACAPTGPVGEPVPVYLISFGGVWGGYDLEEDERPAFLEVRSVMWNLMPSARQVTRERMTEGLRECALLAIPGVPQDPHSEEGQRFVQQWVTWISGWIADDVFRWLYLYVDDEDSVKPWAVELAERYLSNGMGGEHAMNLLRRYPNVPGSREALARFAADESLVPELRELAGYELDDQP